MNRSALTPVTVTARHRNWRTGRLETWAAVSADGTWAYVREDAPGTPWLVEHAPTGQVALLAGTLTAARAATADGTAFAHLTKETTP